MYKFIWLYLSSFGIMFAVCSWCQESGVLDREMGSLKGFIALLSGTILYIAVGRRL
tara:strand:- start:733 stop:900 length:168 start_codon:yes stop_codon:yes gene_type:complete